MGKKRKSLARPSHWSSTKRLEKTNVCNSSTHMHNSMQSMYRRALCNQSVAAVHVQREEKSAWLLLLSAATMSSMRTRKTATMTRTGTQQSQLHETPWNKHNSDEGRDMQLKEQMQVFMQMTLPVPGMNARTPARTQINVCIYIYMCV